jgi:hypothetical protein
MALDLSVREIREAVRACAHLRVPDPAPVYLQRFLALRVQQDDPDLAAKLNEMSPNCCAELFHLIRSLQQAAREDE